MRSMTIMNPVRYKSWYFETSQRRAAGKKLYRFQFLIVLSCNPIIVAKEGHSEVVISTNEAWNCWEPLRPELFSIVIDAKLLQQWGSCILPPFSEWMRSWGFKLGFFRDVLIQSYLNKRWFYRYCLNWIDQIWKIIQEKLTFRLCHSSFLKFINETWKSILKWVTDILI